jgi:predicted transcriptional regulator
MMANDSNQIMKTLKVGIATHDQFKMRTLMIAKGEYRPSENEPQIWFSSLESFAKVLSDKNRELLILIAQTEPNSLQELVESSGRAKSNLSRTLSTLENYGLIYFEESLGRKKAPRVAFTDLHLDLSLRAS